MNGFQPLAQGYPNFSVYLANTQSFGAAAFTRCNFDTVNYDPSGAWNAANHRWIPKRPGRYHVSAGMFISSVFTTAPGIFSGYISLNGANNPTGNCRQGNMLTPVGTCNGLLQLNGDIYLNGTTDFIEIYGYASQGSPTFQGSQPATFFEASYLGS